MPREVDDAGEVREDCDSDWKFGCRLGLVVPPKTSEGAFDERHF